MGASNGYVVRAGYRPSGDDDNRFQSEAIYESGATKAVVLIQCSWAIWMLIRKPKGAMCASRIA